MRPTPGLRPDSNCDDRGEIGASAAAICGPNSALKVASTSVASALALPPARRRQLAAAPRRSPSPTESCCASCWARSRSTFETAPACDQRPQDLQLLLGERRDSCRRTTAWCRSGATSCCSRSICSCQRRALRLDLLLAHHEDGPFRLADFGRIGTISSCRERELRRGRPCRRFRPAGGRSPQPRSNALLQLRFESGLRRCCR